MRLPSIDETEGRWKQQAGDAKIVCGRLSKDELLMFEGHAQKMIGLTQEHYVVTWDEAERHTRRVAAPSVVITVAAVDPYRK